MSKSNTEKNSLHKTIVLIGMMGSGKSTVGAALARMLSMPFVDADHEIEHAAGCRVSDIFAHYGEAEFRRLEQQVIARLLREKPRVLSLGGGAFINQTTRDLIKQTALSIWLRVDRDVLLRRVKRHGDRPMLQGSDPAAKMAELHLAREPLYAEADLIVDCDDRPVAQTAGQVSAALIEYINRN